MKFNWKRAVFMFGGLIYAMYTMAVALFNLLDPVGPPLWVNLSIVPMILFVFVGLFIGAGLE